GEDHASPAEAVRELTGDGAAEDGAEHHSRGDPADHTRLVAQPPVVLEERQRAGHHADVIAEENSAERAEEVDERAGDLLVIVHDDNIPFWMDGQRISESRNRLHCRSSETQLCRSLQKVSANISVARNVNRTARGCQRYFSPACSGGCAVELRTNRTGGTADISGSWPPISAAAASSTRCPRVVKTWWTVVRAGLKQPASVRSARPMSGTPAGTATRASLNAPSSPRAIASLAENIAVGTPRARPTSSRPASYPLAGLQSPAAASAVIPRASHSSRAPVRRSCASIHRPGPVSTRICRWPSSPRWAIASLAPCRWSTLNVDSPGRCDCGGPTTMSGTSTANICTC